MKAFKCDLCAQLVEGEPTKELDVPLGKQLRMVASLRVEDHLFDLCPNCVLRLREELHRGFNLAIPEEKREKLDFDVEAWLRKLEKSQ